MRVKDSLLLGLIIGIFAPIIFLFIFYLLRYRVQMGAGDFVQQLFEFNIHSKIMALSIFFSNLILFYIFIKAEFLKIARGILFATILYTFLMLILKFL